MNLTKIHEDNRGSIHSLTGKMDLPEVAIMRTVAGLARGGCIHRESYEYLCVIEGKITYHFQLPGSVAEVARVMIPGDVICIPPMTPHYMVSDTDSLIMEWGPKPEEKIEKHTEMRRMVIEHNSHV